jgi:hypothetical protein
VGVVKRIDEDPPAGFLVLRTLLPGGGYEQIDILVPAREKDALAQEARLRAIRYEAQEEAQRKASNKQAEEVLRREQARLAGEPEEDEQEESDRGSNSFWTNPAPGKVKKDAKKEKRPGRNEIDPDEEQGELLERAAADLAHRLAKHEQLQGSFINEADTMVPVYQVLEPMKLIAKTLTPDREVKLRNETLYLDLKKKGHLRLLAAPDKDTLDDLKALKASFPHFGEVVDLVARQVMLHAKQQEARMERLQDSHGRGSVYLMDSANYPSLLPPILLSGPPGVGKTRFTQELGMLLGIPVRRQAFDNAQSGTALTGSDRHWSNTHFGLVFELLAMGEVANPVVLLDEIDKCSNSRYGGHPLASLHSLLEPGTASRVKDLSTGMELNAKHMLWIATANDPALIENSLRSRFVEFWIEHPTGEGALSMAMCVAREVHGNLGLDDMAMPSRRVIAAVAHLTGREQVAALKHAFAAAVADGREAIETSDLPLDLQIELEQERLDLLQSGKKDKKNNPGSGLLH